MTYRSRSPFASLSRAFSLGGATLASIVAMYSSAALADQAATSPRETWHHDIQQGYQQLNRTTESLAEAFTPGCDALDQDALAAHWLDAYQAWQAVRFVDFGPIEVDSRAWQLQFWPDNKNLVGSRIASRLRQETAVTPADIAAAGVAEQGFPALEYLLFDDAMTQHSLQQPNACALAQAISQHLAQVASELNRDWQAFRSHYLATDSYSEATVHAALQSLEILEDKRLGEPLGMMGAPANGYRAEAWRSDASITLATATLEGLQAHFVPGLARWLSQQHQDELAAAFSDQLKDTLDQARQLDTGIAAGLQDDQARQQLATLYLEVAQLRQVLGDEIAPALGIVRGFNSSDGD